MTRIPARPLFLLALLVLGLAAGLWWGFPGDPVHALQRRGAVLRRVERMAACELGERVERWKMFTVAGDTLTALWRAAPPGTDSPWTIVLLGGLVAGDRAALLVPDHCSSHLLAVDWPWRESRHMSWWRVALRLGAIRRVLLRSPGVLAVGVEAAARAPEVDANHIALVGVSLGVPPAVSACRLTRRPAALALLHGGANLRLLLGYGLRRQGFPEFLAAPLSALAARLIHPLEPSLHATACGGRVLVVNAVADPLLPRASVEGLHQLFPLADVRWCAALHGVPDQRAAVADLAQTVQVWLDSLP